MVPPVRNTVAVPVAVPPVGDAIPVRVPTPRLLPIAPAVRAIRVRITEVGDAIPIPVPAPLLDDARAPLRGGGARLRSRCRWRPSGRRLTRRLGRLSSRCVVF